MLFKLDLSEKSYTQCKDLSQFDDRTITVQLFENGQPYLVDTKTIKLEAKNSNNNAVIQTAGITKKGNVITVELMKDITRVSGKVEMKIVLTENSKNISTFKFMLNVDSSVTESANILPSITVDVIELLQDKINQAILVKQETEHLIATGGAASKGDVIKLTEQLDSNIQQTTQNTSNIISLVNSKADKTEINRLDTELDSMEQQKATKAEVQAERARIDLLTKIENGQTDGNTELLDLRIDSNGNTHETAGQSIRTNLKSILDTLERDNIFDYGLVQKGKYIETNGIITDNVEFYVTDYISVKTGDVLKFASDSYPNGNTYSKTIVVYNLSKVVNTSLGQQNVLDKYIVPSGINYVKICFKPTQFTNFRVGLNYYPNTIDNKYKVSNDSLNLELKHIVENSTISRNDNIFNKNTISNNYALNNTGSIYVNDGYYTTDFINVDTGIFNCSLPFEFMAIYDSNKTFVSFSNTISKDFSIVKNNYFVRLSFRKICSASSVLTIYKKYSGNDEIIVSDLYPWRGKSWCSYGDSITAVRANSSGWQEYVNALLKFSSHTYSGIAGSTVTWNDNKQCGCSWNRIINNTPSNTDLIFIKFGTNDMAQNKVIGNCDFDVNNTNDTEWNQYCISNNVQVGDFNLTTFKGALCSTIRKMQIRYPNSLIVLGTPLSGRGNDTSNMTELVKNNLGLSTLDYANAVKEVAMYMSVGCVDVYGTCQINQFNRKDYLTDQVHPFTENGLKLLGRCVASGLKNIFPLI